ncbi:MAG: hypothetical protein ACQGVK_24885 [Myxococcota bacterium]
MRSTGVAALVIGACLLGMSSLVGGAETPLVDDACEQSCRVQESECISACGRHEDPVECEGECRDALQDCLRGCR